jgi:predicted phage terminase large subunit-like protein
MESLLGTTEDHKKYVIKLPDLHEGQKEVAMDPSRFKVLSAGRRWGKTRLGVWLCLRKAWEGGRTWWIAPTYAMALEGWKDLRNIGVEYGTIIKESEKTIITPTGGSVSIRSADNPDRLRGAGLDYVVLDEFAFMKESVWAEVVRPTLTERQGGALFISTPRGFNHFEKVFHQAETLNDWSRWLLPTSSNPYVPKAELEIARKEIGSYLYSQEYEAKFVELSGGMFQQDWFKRFRMEETTQLNEEGYYENRTYVIADDERVDNASIRKIATVDLATSTKEQADFTVVTITGVTPKSKVIVYEVFRKRLEAPDIIPVLKRYLEKYNLDYIGIEKAGFQLALIQIARREGLPVRELRADRDKISRAMPLSARMEGGQVYFYENGLWFDDLQRELLQFPEGEHDDQVDSLAYAILESQANKKWVAY